MPNSMIGVLVMSYGTPESMEGVEEYYTHIRRGRAPSDEQLTDLKNRYSTIVGGVFPLRENTNRQVSSLQQKLQELALGQYRCYQGLKHARPYIEDGVEAMHRDGISRAIGIVLAPHYSTMSVGGYISRAQQKADELGIQMSFVEEYHLHPKLLTALTKRVNHGIETLLDDGPSGAGTEKVKVLFSAHSLPERIRKLNDPYERQLFATADAVARQAGISSDRWQFTWQSAGRTPEPWLGPDILDTLKSLQAEGEKMVLVAPIGFVSDHLEVLYDLDIEAKAAAEELGMKLERIRMLNSDPLYMETLAESVMAKANHLV